jgi:hypothetical protein
MTRAFIVTPHSCECQKPQPLYCVTVTMTVVECVMLPPVPLMDKSVGSEQSGFGN